MPRRYENINDVVYDNTFVYVKKVKKRRNKTRKPAASRFARPRSPIANLDHSIHHEDPSSMNWSRPSSSSSHNENPEENWYDANDSEQDENDNADLLTSHVEPTDLRTAFIEPVFLAAETQDFARQMAGQSTSIQIPLNDLHDDDIQSVSSADTVEEFATSFSNIIVDDVAGVPSRPVQEPISDFLLAFGLWSEREGLKRNSYNGLLEVLHLLDSDDIRTLPRHLGTLHKWCRNRLPLPPIQKAVVPVKIEKQPSGMPRTSESSMYFFDLRIILSTIMSAPKWHVFHTGMAEVVDKPSEYWHSNAWGSSIRTCSRDFAVYSDLTPVFPSDFVNYRPSIDDEEASNFPHVGQVVFFGRDQRIASSTRGKVLLKIRPVKTVYEVLQSEEMISSSSQWAHDDLMLLENADHFIQPEQISCRRTDLKIHRIYATSSIPVCKSTSIQHVFNVINGIRRSITLLSPVRGELELEAYGRGFLTDQLSKGIESFPLIMFVDAFGLYRNMYRSLTGVYALPAALSGPERQKSQNCFTLTLGPHGSNFNDVLGKLHTGIEALDRGCVLKVNGEDKLVWAPILAYLGDMKQQQESAGFLGPRAKLSCRFCDADIRSRGDLTRDVVSNGRYHHGIMALRQEASFLRGKIKKEKFFSQHGLSYHPSVIAKMNPALDIILSFPPDPAHSEYYGMVRRLYPFIGKYILSPKAFLEFNLQFQRFPFPPGWGRIQSPAHHMASWSMSECGKASIIIPILFRCWLKPHHVRPSYVQGLKRELSTRGFSYQQLTAVDAIVMGFGRLAKSNSLISSFSMSDEDRSTFQEQILCARDWVLLLMNAEDGDSDPTASKPKRGRPKKPKPKRQQASSAKTVRNVSCDGTDVSMADSLDPTIESTRALQEETVVNVDMTSLPNFHVAIHFLRMMEEYVVIWNANVLYGEDKHRGFKMAVLTTNHRKPERQLLLKEAIILTVKAMLNGAFAHTDMEITTQLKRLQLSCPVLMKRFFPHVDLDTADDCLPTTSTPTHVEPAFRGKLKHQYLIKCGLSNRLSEVQYPGFIDLMQHAMTAYGLNAINWGNKSLYWYEQFSFTSQATSKRCTFHVGDYVQLVSNAYAQIRHIYTHSFQYDDIRRLFVWIRILEPTPYIDEVLNMRLYRLSTREEIVSLSSIRDTQLYIVPMARQLNDPSYNDSRKQDPDLLLCDWTIHFL